MWGYRGKVVYPFMFFSYLQEAVPDWLFRHELEHIYQVRREGWCKFHAKYLWYLIRYGYKNNPYEVDARKKEHTKLTVAEKKLKNR